MGNNNKFILVHTTMEKVSIEGMVDVMLTPQLYTLKKEALPVKYAYQAKRIAPSLFDGLVDENLTYHYLVLKEKDGWLFIAYAPSEIKDFLIKKGLKVEQIGKVYFAQQSVELITSPLALSEKDALVVLDNLVVVVPNLALEKNREKMKFDTFLRPSRGISLGNESSNTFLSSTQTILLSALFIIFTTMFIVEGMRYGGDLKEQEAELNKIFEKHTSLKSSYTRKSIASKYQRLDKSERKKREMIKALSKMIFKGSSLNTLEINRNKFKATLLVVNRNVEKRVRELSKKQKFKVTKVGSMLNIEGALE